MGSCSGDPTELQQLSWVEGRSIGSALIDFSFYRMLTDRLTRIKGHLRAEPGDVAEKMMHGRFERTKCSYGTEATSAIPMISLEVPDLPPGWDFPNLNIEGSTMKIAMYTSLFSQKLCVVLMLSREELKKAFDNQIERMLVVINQQFDRMQRKHPRTQIVESFYYLNTNSVDPDTFIDVLGLVWRSRMLSLCQTALEIILRVRTRINKSKCPRYQSCRCR